MTATISPFPRRKLPVTLELAPEKPRPRADLHDYEAEQRRKIASINWAKVHVRGDRSAPIDLPERRWWKAWQR